MALKKWTGDYLYNENTNPTRRPLIEWQEGGEDGGTAEPSWQGVPQNEADQQGSDNIGIGMAELIYLKVHPLISPGIDAMDDDLPPFEDVGDNNLDQYMTDQYDMIIYDEEGNPVPNPEYMGGMTMEEWDEMNAKSQEDQITAKQFWVDMSIAIAEGVIDHIKLEHNNPLHRADEGAPGGEGTGMGLETDEAALRALNALKYTIGGTNDSLYSNIRAGQTQMEALCSNVKTFAETVNGNALQQNASAVLMMAVWENTYVLISNLYDVLAGALNTVFPPTGGMVLDNIVDLFMEANSVPLMLDLQAQIDTANDMESASSALIEAMDNRMYLIDHIRNNNLPEVKADLDALDYNTFSKVK